MAQLCKSVPLPSRVFGKGDVWDDKGKINVMRQGHVKIVPAQLLRGKRVQEKFFPPQRDHKLVND